MVNINLQFYFVDNQLVSFGHGLSNPRFIPIRGFALGANGLNLLARNPLVIAPLASQRRQLELILFSHIA
jgi:hypothetical protein